MIQKKKKKKIGNPQAKGVEVLVGHMFPEVLPGYVILARCGLIRAPQEAFHHFGEKMGPSHIVWGQTIDLSTC
jgi:hypothetical protein